MYIYDDRWILKKPLTIVEFNLDEVTIFECRALSGEFYNNRLRKLIVADLINIHRAEAYDGHSTPITESFRIQHGEPMPNTRYIGIAQTACVVDRYFRILSQRVTSPVGYFMGIYELAGLPGEGQGMLDDVLEEFV
jgi:hypothetical protein